MGSSNVAHTAEHACDRRAGEAWRCLVCASPLEVYRDLFWRAVDLVEEQSKGTPRDEIIERASDIAGAALLRSERDHRDPDIATAFKVSATTAKELRRRAKAALRRPPAPHPLKPIPPRPSGKVVRPVPVRTDRREMVAA